MDFSFWDSFNIVAGLMLISAVGFLLTKFGVVKAEFTSALAKVVLYACQPLLMVTCFQRSAFEASSLKFLGEIALVSALFYLFAFAAAKLTFLYEKRREKARVFYMTSMLGNVGFMGIPVVEALFPQNAAAILGVTAVLALFNVFAFTGGIYLITGDRAYISFKKAFLSPTMIGIYVGLAFFFFRVQLPPTLSMPVEAVGNLCIPLSFLILGMRFAAMKPHTLFTSGGAYLSSFIKLLVCPLIALLLCALLPVSEVTRAVLVVTCAMPTASIVLMFAEVFHADSGEAARGLLLSAVLSLLTLPLVLLLL